MKCKILTDNQRILQEARVERAILKRSDEMREKMIADSKAEAQLQGEMIDQTS
jgi:F-type H+-transporting ATPase subunit b